MRMSSACDGFRLAYERYGGGGPPVVLLHGWPGDRTDFRRVVPLLGDDVDVVVPDLRGFGESDKHRVDPAEGYGAAAQARSVAALIEELGLRRPLIGGYDVGSRVAQQLATHRPELVAHLVVSPPLPGVGGRILNEDAQKEFWYQPFHRLALSELLIDGNADAVRGYLEHFWTHWSGPAFDLPDADLEHLVARYSPPGAFAASIGWYRAGSGTVATAAAERPPARDRRIGTPTSVLWPGSDPLFPRAWADRLDDFFADVTVTVVDGVGHFTPLECPGEFAALLKRALTLPA
ncbi:MULTISPECIES: alpha/beta fold hydrolase [unclassified Mycobacterium]|uniref:alpha/beta fold hydrolase n=1 Tax=unclassified Mycobacterium TaxID=2642494 RepID=UPI000801A0C9|nr:MULTISPECIES: alpha/beta hydrolase [unclassified Mycobacterium]OBG70509.1 epoxide hydrolase [Mycobacterium sp. E1214]OBH26992.1 epoxide hydrolase [Mycobacterium sp. E1319]